ncbi:hypothetical protein N1851_023327 [Merluccius polli]|uniref:Uncharacterized protein n=1 Tax=Merluccius polli TaxID=89951 RepID=A0AA47MGE1_MERPO|nr:hypothetical protein N1851_023327 [Merluccius polli]
MGSGLSRSKRIAPVCVAEINVSKRDAAAAAAAAGPRPGEARTSSRTRRFKIPNFTHAAPPCSHDSPRFTEEEEDEEEKEEEEDGNRGKLDRACDGEDRGDVSKMKNGPKKSSFVKSRTYGVLCNFRRVDSNKELNFTPTTTTTNTTNTNTTAAAAAATPSQAFTSSESHHHHGQECGPGDVNRNGNSVSSHVRRHGPTACSSHQEHTVKSQCFLHISDRSFANCLNTPVATPVIRYDGSEEELMDTIERDFS